MTLPDEHTLTFLRGSGFLLHLVGVWISWQMSPVHGHLKKVF
jgi:hypothetical protein